MVVGALLGMVSVIPFTLQRLLHPTVDDAFLGASVSWGPINAGIGALLGAILGPALGYGLLRIVPLWRAVLEPTAGAILGGAFGWIVLQYRLLPGFIGAFAIIWGTALGALIAGVLLRRRYLLGER